MLTYAALVRNVSLFSSHFPLSISSTYNSYLIYIFFGGGGGQKAYLAHLSDVKIRLRIVGSTFNALKIKVQSLFCGKHLGKSCLPF